LLSADLENRCRPKLLCEAGLLAWHFAGDTPEVSPNKVSDSDVQQPMAADPADESALRTLVNRMCEAWSRGDAVAYADCFSTDSDYVTYNGMHLRGRRENADLHGALFRGVLKGTRLLARIESLTFLSQDIALIHTVGAGAKRGRMDSGLRKSIQTLVVVKTEGHWRIRSFQNTRIRPFSVWLTRQMAKSDRP